MTKIGTNSEYASQFADQLIYADQRGHYSHGLNRLRIYVNDIVSGTTAKAGKFVKTLEHFFKLDN